ncbi:MAG: 50S ribosomal protein L30 [Holosporales bacterium]|jgi:ribosomal protein L30/L7E|nr:50S ribosomal protein L30 [Holosporales bacterium]
MTTDRIDGVCGDAPCGEKPGHCTSKSRWLASHKSGQGRWPKLTVENSVTVEQYRSCIRLPKIQRVQLRSLGVGQLGQTCMLPKIPAVLKLVERLRHLVKVT